MFLSVFITESLAINRKFNILNVAYLTTDPMILFEPQLHSLIALFHYDVTSKQSIVLTLMIMVARGDKTAAKQIKSQYNLVYDIVESESS
jgi:hypothetical protein